MDSSSPMLFYIPASNSRTAPSIKFHPPFLGHSILQHQLCLPLALASHAITRNLCHQSYALFMKRCNCDGNYRNQILVVFKIRLSIIGEARLGDVIE